MVLDAGDLVATYLENCNEVEPPASVKQVATTFTMSGKFSVAGGYAMDVDWLPPDPGASGKIFLGGIDSDRDCVRDDIERYIVSLLPRVDQRDARTYLYEYVRWRGQFMNSPSSGFTAEIAKEISNYLYISSECFRIEMHSDLKSERIINQVFAEFHNTYNRSIAYIHNFGLLV